MRSGASACSRFQPEGRLAAVGRCSWEAGAQAGRRGGEEQAPVGAGVGGAGLLLNVCLSKSDSEAAGPPAGSRLRVQAGSITVGILTARVGRDPRGVRQTGEGVRGPGGAGRPDLDGRTRGRPQPARGCGPAPGRRPAGARSASGSNELAREWPAPLDPWVPCRQTSLHHSRGSAYLRWALVLAAGATRELAAPWERWTMTAQTHQCEASGLGPGRHVAGRRPWVP